jgi:coenzyme F420-reducing hydrogenase gamma subunit
VKSIIPIDFYIPGCPIVRKEFVRVVQELLVGKTPYQPSDPVCAECKIAANICVFERGVTCLGPVTRGGCEATCVTNGAVCWGCRGFVDEPNIYAEKTILEKANLSVTDIMTRFNLFNMCQEDL